MITTRVFAETLQAYNAGYRVIANRGGTRSSKTFSELQLLYQIILNSKKQRVISTVSHSFPHLSGGAIRDWEKILTEEGVNISACRRQTPTQYHINKGLHEFIGFDKPGKALGAARDILFINEANKMPFNVCNQLMVRTSECIFLDWNPSEDFWFDTEGFAERPDVKIIDSTFYDNVNASTGKWNLSDGQLFELKTARKKALAEDAAGKRGYWWNWWQVYGLGLKGQLEGVIFQNWHEYSELPDCDLYRLWVVDWGGLDPTTFTELNFTSDDRLYIREHIYQPQILNSKLISYIQEVNPRNEPVICDSARKDKVYELQMAGINAMGATKGEGSIIDGIERLQEFSIFVHKDSQNAKNEFKNYKRVQDPITGKYLDIPEDKNNHCFVGDTLILTTNGLIKIKDIEPGQQVYTSTGKNDVLIKFNNGLQLVKKYLIQFDTFSLSLTCTFNHLIKTNTGWIQVDQLKSGMIIYLSNNLTERYTNCTQESDIFQEVQKNYIQKFGKSLKVLFLKGFMFIISIKTHGITILKILNLKKVQDIKENTEKKEQKIILNGLNSLMKKEENPQRNGTHQRTDLFGIQKWLNNNGKNDNLKFLYVKNAENNIKQSHSVSQNFVMLTVKHVHCEKEEKTNVYDLMIDGEHEYFANGVLVHNCIDPCRYGARFYRRSIKPL